MPTDLNHIHLHPDFSSIETIVCYTTLLWCPETLGVPHTSHLLKAFAGSGFDANLCADVYNLYVKEIYLVERAFLRGNHFNAVSWIADTSTRKKERKKEM
jgi:hypothetical protein